MLNECLDIDKKKVFCLFFLLCLFSTLVIYERKKILFGLIFEVNVEVIWFILSWVNDLLNDVEFLGDEVSAS
jgi:hypothetical protein